MKRENLYPKIKHVLFRFWPILFLIGLVLLLARPYILDSRVPFPSDYQVNHFAPWSNDPSFAGPVKNGAMPDIIDQIYPWKHFTVEVWEHGTIPFWNPNNFAGNPHLANFQSTVFSPFILLFLVLPFIDAWSLMIFAQPLIAGIAMYLLLRSYNISRFGSVIAGVSFMFSGFIVVWMAYGTLAMAISALPLILYAVKQYFETARIRFGLLLSGLIAFSFFSGHFQTSLYVLLFSGAFYLAYTIHTKQYRKSFSLAGFFLLGLLLSSIQLIPTIQFYLLSPRSENYITEGGIPWNYLITIVAPDFFGNPVTRNDWFGYYAEWASFIGVIPLFFAFVTLFVRKTFIVRFLWTGIAVILFLLVSSPVQELLGILQVPVLSTSNPSRIVVLLSFSLAFLSGFGVDQFTKALVKRNIKQLLLPFVSVVSVLACTWIILLFKPYQDEYVSLSLRNFILPTLLFGSLCGLMFVAFLFRKKQFVMPLVMVLVVCLVSFDSLRFATKWMPFGDRELVFPDLPVIHAMQEEVGHGRVFGNIGAHITTYYNIPGIEGYDPLYIDRYGQFVNGSQDGLFHQSERSVVKAPRNGIYIDRLLDILGVTLIFHPIADTNQSWAYPVWSDVTRFEEVYKDDYFQLFRNKTAIPRGSMYYSYEVISNDREAIKRFYDNDFDHRNTLILEKDPELETDPSSTRSGSVTFVKDDPAHTIFEVESSSEGLLFLSDNYYPGWKAFVNGEEVEVFRANHTFRAVKVPEGTSEVEFIYEFGL